MSPERGSVLVGALWLVVLLGLIGLSLSTRVREDARWTDRRWAVTRRNQEAKRTALHFERRLLASTGTATTVADIDGWAVRLGSGVAVHDESARVNLNTAPAAILRRLLGSDEAAAGILDWRDADSRVNADGAEASFYAALERPYPCRNGPLASVEEVLLIRGVTPAMFERIKDRVTVWGDGKVNLNTVSKETLIDLGFSAAAAESVAAFRAGPDGSTGTGDDGVFHRGGDAPPSGLTQDEARLWRELATIWGVRASAVRLDFAGAPGLPRLGLVLSREGDAWRGRSWREGEF